MDFASLMRFAAGREASDIHLQTGLSPKVRIQGILHTVDQPALGDEEIRQFIASIAPPRMRDKLDDRLREGMDFSYAAPGICRFRCSGYQVLGNPGIAMRLIKGKIPTTTKAQETSKIMRFISDASKCSPALARHWGR